MEISLDFRLHSILFHFTNIVHRILLIVADFVYEGLFFHPNQPIKLK